jgi:hypothetical protein
MGDNRPTGFQLIDLKNALKYIDFLEHYVVDMEAEGDDDDTLENLRIRGVNMKFKLELNSTVGELVSVSEGMFDETLVRVMNKILELARKFKSSFLEDLFPVLENGNSHFDDYITKVEDFIERLKKRYNKNPKHGDETGVRLVASIMEALYE